MVESTLLVAPSREALPPSFSKSLSEWLRAPARLVVGPIEGRSWMPPGKPPAPIADEARLAAEQLDVYLAPGPAERIARVIAGTLRVYFDRDFEAGDEIAIEFWLADLADLPAWAVEKACASWRRLEEKRPTPANIRALAFKELREHHETQRRLRATLAAA